MSEHWFLDGLNEPSPAAVPADGALQFTTSWVTQMGEH